MNARSDASRESNVGTAVPPGSRRGAPMEMGTGSQRSEMPVPISGGGTGGQPFCG
jgi:hypothetical protein